MQSIDVLDREVDPARRVDRRTAGHRVRPAIHTIRDATGVAGLWVRMCGSNEVTGLGTPRGQPGGLCPAHAATLRPFVEATGGLALHR